MQIEIVPFEERHLEAVVRLSLRAWEPVFVSMKQILDPEVYAAFYPDWRVEQRKAVTEACLAEDHDTWVALADGTVAGFVDCVMRDPVLGEIHMLAVDPAFQHRGIGTRLTEFGTERLKQAGASVAMIETGGDDGHGPARLTYEKAGYRLFPVARFFKGL